ncbi:MAG: BatD family protein [Gammaproteobacteria bacterium]|nr:BatD family protein [Gammaproteobacteria bacterium]MCW8923583.1 BatD family protein [Gammaproteobacteria bacterium]
MKHQIRFLFIVILSLSFLNTVQAANITAQLDRSHIFLDESFRLVLEADDSVDNNPDFSPLHKDFEILGQSQSTNMSIVNGQYSRKGIWTLELMAKRTGALTIPSVSFGKDQSPALRIQIKDPATAKKPVTKNKDVFLQVEIEENKAWVQSQVIFNVRLFSRISMSNLRSSEPETSDPDAIIKQLGDATSYEAFRDGVRYAVHEIRYAVFPQHSGKLQFKPIIFEGRVHSGRARSFIDQFMNAGERKRVRSNSISIEVQAKPSNIKLADWLPAKQVTLTEDWSEDVLQLKNGEPVTRTISINAHGMMAENLPDLSMAEISDLKQYPDKAAVENRVTDKGVSSVKQIKVALIPTRAGDFKLPAITLPWWNTATGKQEMAHLPEKLIRAHGVAANTPPPAIDMTQMEKTEAGSVSPSTIPQIADAGYWPWLSLILGLGWLITLVALLQRRPGTTVAKTTADHPSLRTLEKAVHKQAGNNEAGRTKDALLSWGKARWPDLSITSLADISHNVDTDLADEINMLSAALYSSSTTHWQGSNLLRAFKAFKQQKNSKNQIDDQQLEPLYK